MWEDAIVDGVDAILGGIPFLDNGEIQDRLEQKMATLPRWNIPDPGFEQNKWLYKPRSLGGTVARIGEAELVAHSEHFKFQLLGGPNHRGAAVCQE